MVFDVILGLIGGFWHHGGVLVEVFGILSLPGEHLVAENRVEPSSGASWAPSGVVWEGPGRVLTPRGASSWVPFDSFWKVFWERYLVVRCNSIFAFFLIRFVDHFLVPASFV